MPSGIYGEKNRRAGREAIFENNNFEGRKEEKKNTILIRKSNILDEGKSKYNPLKQINTKIFRRLIIKLVWVE